MTTSVDEIDSVSQNSSTAVTLKEFKFMAKKKRIASAENAGPSKAPRPIQKFKRLAVGSALKPLKPDLLWNEY